MWTREQLKKDAKEALRRYYWVGFAVILVMGLFTGGSSVGSVDLEDPAILSSVWGILAIFVTVSSFVGLLIYIFLKNIIEVGKNRFFLESRLFKSPFTRLFCGFTSGTKIYGNILKTLLIRDVKIILWTMLLVVPGIIKSYEYFMVPYILAENPHVPTQRAFELSKQMTEGEKMNMFVLDLSFFGWYLLGALACGVGMMFVVPYHEATNAELYNVLRMKLLSQGLTDENELPGFCPTV